MSRTILPKITLIISLFAMVLFWNALPCRAVEIYFNKVKITGLKDQQFKNCGLKFDANGDLYISASQYKVKQVGEGEDIQPEKEITPRKDKLVTKDYFLVFQQTARNATGYNLTLLINKKLVRSILNRETQVVIPVTDYLRKGKNTLTVKAVKKNYSKAMKKDKTSVINLILGMGKSKNQQLMIEKPLVEYKRRANETKNYKNDFIFQAK